MQELGATFRVGDIPADLMDEAQEWREKLLEQVVEMDDDAMEKYLDVCAYLPHLPPLRHPALPYVLPCCALNRILCNQVLHFAMSVDSFCQVCL